MTVIINKPGDEVTLTVSAVETVASEAKPGTFRYQIDGFLDDGIGERVYINTPVLDRELVHKKLTVEGLIGGRFRFWRKAAPNNTPVSGYLNMDVLETEGEWAERHDAVAPSAAPKPAARPAAKAAANPAPAKAAAPKAAASVTDEERATAEDKKKAERRRLREFRHHMFSDEAVFQLATFAKLCEQFPDGPVIMPTAESVNAATSTDFIEFNRRGLI